LASAAVKIFTAKDAKDLAKSAEQNVATTRT
jgi:hypothetical protein